MATANITTHRCSISECERKRASKGYCSVHYARIQRTGSPYRLCKTCGSDMEGKPGKALYCSARCKICPIPGCVNQIRSGSLCSTHLNIKRHPEKYRDRFCKTCGKDMRGYPGNAKYCSSECKICTQPGCKSPVLSKGLCQNHYQRKRNGYRMDIVCATCGEELLEGRGKARYCGPACRPRCSAQGCSNPYYSSDGYCGMHKVRLDRHGTLDIPNSRTPKADKYTCDACGIEFKGGDGRRRYCSGRCQALGYRYKNNIPSLDFDCGRCGKTVKRDRFDSSRQRPSRLYCDGCQRRDDTSYRWLKAEIRGRGYVECGICTQPIDLDLKYPDRRSLTIDHIIPFSLGGSDEAENLRPAHASCNARRGNKTEFPIQLAIPIN